MRQHDAQVDSDHVIQYQTTLADGGDPNAQIQLGLIHGQGLYGNVINLSEAFRRYAQAGNNNNNNNNNKKRGCSFRDTEFLPF